MRNTASEPDAKTFALPTRLSFSGRRNGHLPELVPGRGDAGWTVYQFATADERTAFMARHPEAAMPCWGRIAA